MLLAVGSISAAVVGVASPPSMRIAAGCIFLIAALYFWQICPARDERPKWVVPLFGLIGTVFVISGLRIYLPDPYSPFVDVISGLGFIMIGLAMWWVVGVFYLEDVPEVVEMLTDDSENE